MGLDTLLRREVTFEPVPGVGHSYLTFKVNDDRGQIWFTLTFWHGEATPDSGSLAYADFDGEYGDHLYTSPRDEGFLVFRDKGAEGLWPWLEAKHKEYGYLWD